MVHRVAAIISDGADPFEFAIACEVFGLERPEIGVDLYDFTLCAPDGHARIGGGIEVATPGDLAVAAAADTLIAPHGRPHGRADPEVLDAIRSADDRGARLVSFCAGAFTLAEAGVLDGRRATTHWRYTEQFRTRFPRVALDPEVLFVDEGRILTSAGSAAGIDLALHVVRRDHGAEVAHAVARRLVVPPHRDGGQAQYIAPPAQARIDAEGIAALLDELRAELHRDIPVADMAARLAMSERTFARRFKEATGTTPHRWLRTQRLAHAQELLEATDWDVDRVADRSGFGTAANLRAHFRRELRTTPSGYRRAFRSDGSGLDRSA